MAQSTLNTNGRLIAELPLEERIAAGRSEFKGWLNEQMFLDAKGRRIENPWHIKRWFALAEKHGRLLIEAAREHAKTSVFAVALPLIEMKLNRNIRILIVSDVHAKSQERARLLREHITSNPRYKWFQPEVRIDRKSGDYEFTIRRDRILKEPTVRSTYAGGPISGSRWDLIVLDDLVSYQGNSYTPEQRKKLQRWYADEVLNSVAHGGKIWAIGTKQHHDDLYEHIKRDPAFHAVAYPALDEHGDLGYAEENVHAEGNDAICLWPAMHDYEELVAKREANPDSFMRQQQLVAIPETGLVYRRPLVDAAFERGKDVAYEGSATQFVAVDPGYAKRAVMLAVQERSGDRVELWAEHSFTQMTDDYVAEVVATHCVNHNVLVCYYDAESPELGAAIANALWTKGGTTRVQQVPFGKYKRLSIKATRWMLGLGLIAWGAQTTTEHRPGRTRTVPSMFREEVRDYALKEGTDDEPMKGDDHGPDAWTAYAVRWIEAWSRTEAA